MDLKRHWNAKLHAAVPRALASLKEHKAFTGFVANVDAMKFVDGKAISRLLSTLPEKQVKKRLEAKNTLAIDALEDFAAALLYCFANGKALELPCHDPRIFEWFAAYFHGHDGLRMGGQAGIIANQLAALGSDPVCYCPMLSPVQAKLFDARVRFPAVRKGALELVPAAEASGKGDKTKVNWIFEFAKGDSLRWDGRTVECPRSNRLIVLSKLVSFEPAFSQALSPHLPALARKFDRAMIAGFHHLHSDRGSDLHYHLRRLCGQLDTMKNVNRSLKVHVEYVMISDEKLAREVYTHVGRPADSLGINEVEMHHVLKMFGQRHELEALRREESAFSLYLGARALARRFDFSRVHAHTLGYYVLYADKKKALGRPEEYVDSLLLAAKASEVRAAFGRPPEEEDLLHPKSGEISVSDAGLKQLAKFAQAAKLGGKQTTRMLEDGVAKFSDHYAFVVPTPITPKPKSTVGLGDTISSTAFVSEP
ncbi:MAG: ADP-dependent glucokinase/phosphofructokinase [Candidatus Micrarchaeota archaeon]